MDVLQHFQIVRGTVAKRRPRKGKTASVCEPLETRVLPATLVVNPTSPSDFASIQSAIDAAADGDTIEIRPGSYAEALVVNRAVTLLGTDASGDANPVDGVDDVLIDPTNRAGRNDYGLVVVEHTDGHANDARLAVQDLQIRDADFGLFFANWGQDVLLDGVHVTNHAGDGVHAVGVTGEFRVHDSVFADNGDEGLEVHGNTESTGQLIVGGDVGTVVESNGDRGLLVSRLNDVQVMNAIVRANASTGLQGADVGSVQTAATLRDQQNGAVWTRVGSLTDSGQYLANRQNGLTTHAVNSVSLQTEASGNGGTGIRLNHADAVTISNSIANANADYGIVVVGNHRTTIQVLETTATNNDANADDGGDGLNVWNSKTLIVRGGQFSATAGMQQSGVWTRTVGAQAVLSAELSGNSSTGYAATNSDAAVTLRDSILSDNGGFGAAVSNVQFVDLRRNNLENNAVGGFYSSTNAERLVSDNFGQSVVFEEAGIRRDILFSPSASNPRNSEGDFLRLKDGRLLFVYSHFTGGNIDSSTAHLAGRISSDDGQTWSDDFVVLENEGQLNVMSVTLTRLTDDRIGLFYLRKNADDDLQLYLRTSDNEAVTFSEPTRVTSEAGYFVVNNDRVIRTNSGRLLVPASKHNDAGGTDFYPGIVTFHYSDDDGTTWQMSDARLTAPASSATGLQEPGVVQLSDGRIMMWARTDQGSQFVSYSADDGETWTAAVASNIISPVSPASIRRVPNSDALILAWNDHSNISPELQGKRTPFSVAVSFDDGATWVNTIDLESDPHGWYAYTAIEFVGDQVLLAHTAGRPEIGLLALTQITTLDLSRLGL